MARFELPKELPQTYEQVIALVDKFTQFCPDASSSFGHIVLDDYNLEDSYIDGCLERERIDDWREWRLEGMDKSTPLVEANNRLQLEKTIIQVIRFMQYLKMIPKEAR